MKIHALMKIILGENKTNTVLNRATNTREIFFTSLREDSVPNSTTSALLESIALPFGFD